MNFCVWVSELGRQPVWETLGGGALTSANFRTEGAGNIGRECPCFPLSLALCLFSFWLNHGPTGSAQHIPEACSEVRLMLGNCESQAEQS